MKFIRKKKQLFASTIPSRYERKNVHRERCDVENIVFRFAILLLRQWMDIFMFIRYPKCAVGGMLWWLFIFPVSNLRSCARITTGEHKIAVNRKQKIIRQSDNRSNRFHITTEPRGSLLEHTHVGKSWFMNFPTASDYDFFLRSLNISRWYASKIHIFAIKLRKLNFCSTTTAASRIWSFEFWKRDDHQKSIQFCFFFFFRNSYDEWVHIKYASISIEMLKML